MSEYAPKHKEFTLKRKAAIGALVLASAAGVQYGKSSVEAEPIQPIVGTYEVKPGDTIGNIAERIAPAIEGTQTQDQAETFLEAINKEQGLQKTEGLTAEMQTINLPVEADVNPDDPGIQLPPVEK